MDDSGGRDWLSVGAWWLVSVVVAVAHNGLWATPNLQLFSVAAIRLGENPFIGAVPGDYVLTNLAMTGLARLTAQTAPNDYVRLHLVVLVVGWAAVVTMAMVRFGPRTARALTVVLAASPLVTVSMQWAGQPDPLTGLCGVAMVLVRRVGTLLVLAVVAGLAHAEQAAVMVVGVALVRAALPALPRAARLGATGVAADRSPSGVVVATRAARTEEFLWSLAAGLGGVALGRALVEVYLRLNDIVLLHPRTDYLAYGVRGFLDHHAQQPAGLLWTLWGPLWLVVAGLGVAAVRRRQDAPLGLWAGCAAAAGLALVPMAVTLDETRVYAVCSAAVLAGLAIGIPRQLPARTADIAAVCLLVVTALVPGGFTTGVTSWRNQLPSSEMVRFLRSGELPEGDDDITLWLLAPLDVQIKELPGAQ